jgi:hypothetical protein
MGKKWPTNFTWKPRLPRDFQGSLTCRKSATWDRRLYFPSKGRRAEDFFARKIWRLRPGLNPWTWVPEASTLTTRPPMPLATLGTCYSVWMTVWYGTLHTRQSSTQNNKYQVLQKPSCFSWWWAHSRPKHVEIDKHIKNKLCTKLALFTRLYRNARSTERKIHSFTQSLIHSFTHSLNHSFT